MADFISTQDLINVKQDIEDIGLSVNTDGVITPRYGAAYDSLPKVIREMIEEKELRFSELQTAIDTAVAAGVGAAGWYSYLVVHDNGETQKQINDYIGATWYARTGGYGVNDKARLTTGEVVLSTIANNINNPNTDMTGWVKSNSDSQIFDESGLTQQEVNNGIDSIADLDSIPSPFDGQRVFVKSYYKATNFALAKPFKGGGARTYVSSLSNRDDGGVCIKGWVLNDVSDLNVYHFGAFGDWDAINQTGHDDTLAFQNYARYLIDYENNPREGGSRIMKVLAGNYRLDGFTITQGSSYWSFNLVGDGQLSQLWFNPNGQGIVLEQENSVFQDISLNGNLTATYPTSENPAIPSIVTAKLANKLLDVDFVGKNVWVSWFNTFATISGRGFTLQNSSIGMGATLFKLNLTNDLIVSGSNPKIHSIESALRHFNISNSRFDVVDRVFDIVGDSDSPLKNYINGLTIANNELTLVSQMGRSTLAGCRLVSPNFLNNLCVGCFGGQIVHAYGAIKNGLDSGNQYYNFISGSVADSATINRLYLVGVIDGLTITNTKAKDVSNMLVHASTSVNNVKISNCTFDNIFDAATGLKSLVYCPSNPTNVDIHDNTLNSVNSTAKTYVSSDSGTLQNSTTILIKDNIASAGFSNQSQSPAISVTANGVAVPNADYSTRKCNFTVDDNYIRMAFSISVSNITASTGNIRISLPVVAIADNLSLSAYYSGGGFVSMASGLIGANNIQLQVSASTDQCIKLMSGNLEFNLSSKTSNTLALAGVVSYRFK